MTQTANGNGPLSGIKVVDFGWYYAGSMASVLLADQGATVVKVVRPGGAELPDVQYKVLNRNKHILELDLKSEEGQAQARELIAGADVVVENFRPGVMKRLGLDYASVKASNPALVYLSLPGFASNDEERAHVQAWEGILAAATGFYRQSHRSRQTLGFPPVYTWVPLNSAHGAMHGATAIMAALWSRLSTGQGTYLEVPLYDAGISAIAHWPPGAAATVGEHKVPEPLLPYAYDPADDQQTQLAKLKKAGEVMVPSPFYILPYECGDGRHLVTCVGGNIKHIELFLKKLGLYKQLLQKGYVNEGPWVTDADNNLSGTLSPERMKEVKSLIQERFLTKPAEEWETLLSEIGCPVAMVRTREEWFDLPVMHESGVFADMGEGIEAAGRFCTIDDGSDFVNAGHSSPAQIAFADAKQLLGAPVKAQTHGNDVVKKGDLLKSVRVLDFSNVLAGPLASYILAQYGAEVMRLEPPEGPGLLPYKLDLMQGKESLLVSLNTAPGMQVLKRLIENVDVVLHNCLDDVATRLGITQEQLRAINPNIISCQVSAFGGATRGGWAHRPGYDCLVQATSGLMTSFGSLESPEDHGAITCADVMAGGGAGFSTILALWHKRQTGKGSGVRMSLARAINFTQYPFMIREKGNSYWGEAHGQFALGPSLAQRLYQCADDWMYVGTADATVLAKTVCGAAEPDEKQLEASFATKGYAHWLEALGEAGIACQRVVAPTELCADGVLEVDNDAAEEAISGSSPFWQRSGHPGDLSLIFAAPSWVRVGEGHNVRRLRAASALGQDTCTVLARLGYEQEAITELQRLKVVHDHHPRIAKGKILFDPAA